MTSAVRTATRTANLRTWFDFVLNCVIVKTTFESAAFGHFWANATGTVVETFETALVRTGEEAVLAKDAVWLVQSVEGTDGTAVRTLETGGGEIGEDAED